MVKLGKFFVEVDTSVTGGEVQGYHFPYVGDRDAKIVKLVQEYGIEVIKAIGDYQ